MIEKVIWCGHSGEAYSFETFETYGHFKKFAGLYIFEKCHDTNGWTPVYIGQTENLGERFDDHHKIDCIKAKGATHIHVLATECSKEMRLKQESDLIKGHPLCLAPVGCNEKS